MIRSTTARELISFRDGELKCDLCGTSYFARYPVRRVIRRVIYYRRCWTWHPFQWRYAHNARTGCKDHAARSCEPLHLYITSNSINCENWIDPCWGYRAFKPPSTEINHLVPSEKKYIHWEREKKECWIQLNPRLDVGKQVFQLTGQIDWIPSLPQTRKIMQLTKRFVLSDPNNSLVGSAVLFWMRETDGALSAREIITVAIST